MTTHNITQILITVFACFLSIGAMKYTPIKKAVGIKEKVKCFFMSTSGETVYFILMFVCMVAVSILIMHFYNKNTLIFNIKRIVILSVLWIAAFFDKKSYRIPNKLILLGLVLRVVILVFELIYARNAELVSVLILEIIAAAAMVVLSLLCMLITKNGIGMGDVKLFLVMGLYLGVKGIIPSMMLSMLVTFFVAVTLLVMKKKNRRDYVPFAPGIMVGTMLAIGLTGA